MVHDLVILSPEKTMVSFRLASLGSRILAHLLDLLIMAVSMVLLAMIFAVASAFLLPGVGQAFGMILFALGPFLYFIVLEGFWNGQTPGKKAMNLRVRMADGTPISFAAALGRNLLRPADLLPGTYFLGLLCMFINPRAQRFGDVFANTIVTSEQRAIPVFQPSPNVVGYHHLDYLIPDLDEMTMEEYAALKTFCDRFPDLSRQVQHQVMRDVWEPIRQRHGIPTAPNVHPVHVAEAAVMKYGRTHGLM